MHGIGRRKQPMIQREALRERATGVLTRATGALLGIVFGFIACSAFAQTPTQKPTQQSKTPPTVPAGAPAPPGYVIGPDDALAIIFWFEKDMSADVVVRPDGKISLPLINDIQAVGLTPEDLRVAIQTGAEKFVEDPTVSVVVKAINSRKVFITGNVGKPGHYPLSGPTTVLQLIATAGGLLEYADKKKIGILRSENGRMMRFPFNYEDVAKGKNIRQNIELKPGDTVVVD
jgi:polysaccharide export outer membrane protein